MITFLLILVIIAGVILVLFILAQNPKVVGLSSTFGCATQIIGARQTADFLEKASWYVAIGILFIVLMTNWFVPTGTTTRERQSKMSEQIDQLATPIQQNPTPSQADQQVQNQNQQQGSQQAPPKGGAKQPVSNNK